jgi:uncharacterized protein YcbX
MVPEPMHAHTLSLSPPLSLSLSLFPSLSYTLSPLQASLADLRSKLQAPDFPMARFRPNIVVSGGSLTAWEEDRWSGVVLAGAAGGKSVSMLSVKPCSRCKVRPPSFAFHESF